MIFIIIVGILLVLTAILLTIVVLFQNPRSEGGGMMNNYYGMKQVVGSANIPHILEKFTRILLGILFFLTLLLSNLLYSKAMS